MEKVACIVIDDDLIIRELIAEYINKIDSLNLIGIYESVLDAHKSIQENEIQLIFSDIEMPDLSGIDLVKSLKNPPLVVFLTAHTKYAAESFGLDVLDYIVKPVLFDRFLKSVNKALEHLKLKGRIADDEVPKDLQYIKVEGGYFFIRSDAQFVKIKHDDVNYIEALKDFVKISLSDGKSYVSLVNLKNIEEQLPSGMFVRIHRSYLVNINKIEAISNLDIKIGSQTIPLGQVFKDKVYELVVENKLIKR